jgi:hypothetical protein
MMPNVAAVKTSEQLVAALPFGGAIVVSPGIYMLTALNLAVAGTALFCMPGVVLFFPVVGANAAAINIAAHNVAILGMPRIQGPGLGTYVASENGIQAAGASSAGRLNRLRLEVEVCNFGSAGIHAKFVDNIDISGSHAHDCGYAGAVFASCNIGKAIGYRAKNITPGVSGNAYGLTLTHVTAGYSSDPNAGTPLADNPFCSDWLIEGCLIDDIPTWAGIDCHGAYRARVVGNSVFNCRHGIHVAESSGDAAAYAGWDNDVSFNVVDTRKRDGSAGTCANLGIGISIKGGSAVNQQRAVCIGNRIYGYGVVDGSGSAPSLLATLSSGARIEHNVIESWGGVGITVDGAQGAYVGYNSFGQLADGNDAVAIAIQNQTASLARQMIVGNRLSAAREGLRSYATTRPFLALNDFGAATVRPAYTDVAAGFWAGTDGIPTIEQDLGSGGGTTAVSLGQLAYGTPRLKVLLTAGAPITVTNFTGVPVGTIIEVEIKAGSSTITINRANSVLAGGANFAGGEYDVLIMKCIATSGVQWLEHSRSANS